MLRLIRCHCAPLALAVAGLVFLTAEPSRGQGHQRPRCQPQYNCPQPPPELPTGEGDVRDTTTAADDQMFNAAPPVQSFAGGGEVSVGPANNYIDPAFINTQFRFRYDSAWDNPLPDRAEFFYAKCGCFNDRAAGALFDPDAQGPPLPERSVDYQDLAAYFEYAPRCWLSGFVEVPLRMIDPEVNTNSTGLGDMNAGFKAAVYSCEDNYLTFQFRSYLPTGNSNRGLGTNNVNLEPALLVQRRLSCRTLLFGEARYWIPVDGTDFAGNIVRYGLGGSYDVYRSGCGYSRLSAVAEFVGWTMLDGQAFDGNRGLLLNVTNDTIVNVKVGLRASRGNNSVAASWGHAVSEEVWYEDMLRLEYRRLY